MNLISLLLLTAPLMPLINWSVDIMGEVGRGIVLSREYHIHKSVYWGDSVIIPVTDYLLNTLRIFNSNGYRNAASFVTYSLVDGHPMSIQEVASSRHPLSLNRKLPCKIA